MDVLLVVGVVAVVESESVAYLQLLTSHVYHATVTRRLATFDLQMTSNFSATRRHVTCDVNHAAVGVEHVHNRRPSRVAVT